MRPEKMPIDDLQPADEIDRDSWCVLLYHHEYRKLLISGFATMEEANDFVVIQHYDTDTVSQHVIHGSEVTGEHTRVARLAKKGQ